MGVVEVSNDDSSLAGVSINEGLFGAVEVWNDDSFAGVE